VASTRADHDLLFEALAIHLGFVTRSAVEEARKIVALDDASAISVVAILSDRAGLTAERASVLELLVNDLLARHGGNLRQCLHSLTAFGRLRHDLERRLAGLESRHPTVPSVAVVGRDRANPEARRSNGEAAPGVAAPRPPIDHAHADADDDAKSWPSEYQGTQAGSVLTTLQMTHDPWRPYSATSPLTSSRGSRRVF